MKAPTSPNQHVLLSDRAWIVAVVLLALSLISISPMNAQGCDQGETTAIAGTSAHLEDLVVTVAWQHDAVVEWLDVAIFDENDLQIATQLAWPIPGEQTQTVFDDFLQSLPASGLQFFARVRDAAGQDVTRRHAFRGVLECPRPMEPCQWTTQDGLYTNALALSQPLMTALDDLERVRSSDLLADVLDRRPGLRGPVLTLAAQLDRLDQELDLRNDCFCAWYHSSSHSPDSAQCSDGVIGKTRGSDGSGWEQLEVKGTGAAARAVGQTSHVPGSIHPAAAGSSRQTMEIRCWKVLQWIDQTDLPSPPSGGPQSLRLPKVEACPDACRGVVESSATIDYQLTTQARKPDASFVAKASVDGYLRRNSESSQLPIDTWDACREWPQESDCSSPIADQIQIPTLGVHTDDNVVLVTSTLSGVATVDLKAATTGAWSYARSCFTGTMMRARGLAECAIQPIGEAELAAASAVGTPDCGELIIEPWED